MSHRLARPSRAAALLGPSAARPDAVTVGRMRTPGWNRLEAQRQLEPRAYCVNPAEFGHNRRARFHLPAGGRPSDAWLAQQQHLLIVEWDERGRNPSTSELDRHFGISRQLMSLNATGRRWMGLYEACAIAAFEPRESTPVQG